MACISEQLAQKGTRGNNRRISPRKAVHSRKGPVQYDLKRVAGLRLGLKVSERIGKLVIAALGLNQEPRLAIPHDQEIYLSLQLVTQIAKLEIPKP